jgi:tocopherol O-methyltransferase
MNSPSAARPSPTAPREPSTLRTLAASRSHDKSRSNDKHRIIEHYDVVSPYYRSLWGEHLHHGYWIRGNESKEKAQLQLIEHLAQLASIRPGSEILDIGCGFGASSLYLAKTYAASVTGITISNVQVKMARQAAAEQNLPAQFLLMDAEAMTFAKKFDVLWSVESISHYQDRANFFASAAKLLKPGGTIALIDWFKKENLTPAETRKHIQPIEEGMFVELEVLADYERYLQSSSLRILHREVLNQHCARTWDLSLDIIKDKNLWTFAAKLGSHFITYLRAFQAMRSGFASGNFVYGLFVATSDRTPGS